MKKLFNMKGFTLIELLAVIVILGVVMSISVVSYTSYMNNSKRDGFVSSAQMYANAIKDLMLSNDDMPATNSWKAYSLSKVEMYRGGQSGFDNSDYHGVVFCHNVGTTNEPNYKYYISIWDKAGNYITAETNNLSKKKTATRDYVKTGAANLSVSATGALSAGSGQTVQYGTFSDGTTGVTLPTTGITGVLTAY